VQRVFAYCSDGYRFVSDVLYTNRHQLYGTAGSWFILDIVFYANGLFSGQVTASMGFGKTPKQESIAALILNVSSWAAHHHHHHCETCLYVLLSPSLFNNS
jgi:mannose-6-phosphate isomerase-like protein (cupin superfamily)